jgi:hypothetical protein
MYDGSWSTVKTRSTPTSFSSYTEDMTAKPANNPIQSQDLRGDEEIQFNIGGSDSGHRTSLPRYTEQQSVSESRGETSEQEREDNEGRSVTFADPRSTTTYQREYLFRHQERHGMAMDNRETKVRRCVGSLMP